MFKSSYLLLFFLSFFMAPSSGQDKFTIDSLVNCLSEQTHDSARCNLLFEIAMEMNNSDSAKTLEYLESARRIVTDMNDTRGLGRYYHILGKMHSYYGNYKTAILDFDKALAYFSEAADNLSYFETVKDKGNVYLFIAEYPQAMSHYNSALEFYRRNNISMGISRCLNNIGIIHKNLGEYGEALLVYEESIIYLDSINNALDISEAYINMGNVFVFLGSYERALEYFEKALYIAEKQHSLKDISICLLNSGVVQNKCNRYAEALSLYQRALTVSKTINDQIQVSNCLINIGTNYADMGEPRTGLEYVQRGMDIKIELGDERTISNSYIHMAEIHMMMKEYVRSIELFMAAIPVKKRLGDQEGLVRCYLGLGSVLLDKKQYSEARQMTDHALDIALKINVMEHILQGYETIRDIEVAVGDFHAAYNVSLLHDQYSDSLMNETISKALMELEFRNYSRDLEQENENLHIQSDLTTALMRKRTALFYSILGIALLLFAGLVLVAYFLRRLRISSLKLEEKNLVITKQNLKLDNLNKTKDRMMSIIAHDLRGTIGNQLTAIEVLHRIEGDDDAEIDGKKLLGNLKLSASYSLELLENLLHWSRLKGNESFFHPEEVRLETLIYNCIALFDETAGIKNISLHQEIKAPLNARVDRIMMETVFRNLISNAIKFSNPGGMITISAEILNQKIHFIIKDQGIGMTQEQIHKITNNGGFTRRGTANEKGAGIGMTLVREFTTIHQGELKISSNPHEGSSIEVIIPCIN